MDKMVYRRNNNLLELLYQWVLFFSINFDNDEL
jgi:hypothetical protein